MATSRCASNIGPAIQNTDFTTKAKKHANTKTVYSSAFLQTSISETLFFTVKLNMRKMKTLDSCSFSTSRCRQIMHRPAFPKITKMKIAYSSSFSTSRCRQITHRPRFQKRHKMKMFDSSTFWDTFVFPWCSISHPCQCFRDIHIFKYLSLFFLCFFYYHRSFNIPGSAVRAHTHTHTDTH